MSTATVMDRTPPKAKPIPFDTARLDGLLEQAGLDALLVTSKHNVQYLLGGYRFFFFDYMDAIGTSRYLPVLLYRRGRPQDAGPAGPRSASGQRGNPRRWPIRPPP